MACESRGEIELALDVFFREIRGFAKKHGITKAEFTYYDGLYTASAIDDEDELVVSLASGKYGSVDRGTYLYKETSI